MYVVCKHSFLCVIPEFDEEKKLTKKEGKEKKRKACILAAEVPRGLTGEECSKSEGLHRASRRTEMRSLILNVHTRSEPPEPSLHVPLSTHFIPLCHFLFLYISRKQ
jgi:hypothetical protein